MREPHGNGSLSWSLDWKETIDGEEFRQIVAEYRRTWKAAVRADSVKVKGKPPNTLHRKAYNS